MSTSYHTDQPLPEVSGIYRIICTINGRFYIGSAANLRDRWRRHRNELQRNVHCNQYLQHAWNKYGEDAFTFEVLEYVLPMSLTAREQYWFNKLRPFGRRGFNIAPEAGSSLGLKHTDEAKRKVGDARRGKPAHNRGKKVSPEVLAKMREGWKKRPSPSQETRHKLSIAGMGNKNSLGVHLSEETRRKISEAGMGRVMPTEAVEKSQIGRSQTFIITDPDGNEYTILGLAQFCREHGLDQGTMSRVAQGKVKHHKGWKIRYIEEPRHHRASLGRKNSPEAIAGMIDAHSHEMKTVTLVDPYGVEHTITGLRQLCKEYELDRRSIQRVINGTYKHHKGWRLP